MKRTFGVTLFSTLYLLVYIILIQLNAPAVLIYIMFGLSPFIVLYLAYTISKHDAYKGRLLQEDEHWGYQDKNIS